MGILEECIMIRIEDVKTIVPRNPIVDSEGILWKMVLGESILPCTTTNCLPCKLVYKNRFEERREIRFNANGEFIGGDRRFMP